MNYTITIIICINNNAIINNNYGRLQVHILLFKIPMGPLKDFFEMTTHPQNGSPVLPQTMVIQHPARARCAIRQEGTYVRYAHTAKSTQ